MRHSSDGASAVAPGALKSLILRSIYIYIHQEKRTCPAVSVPFILCTAYRAFLPPLIPPAQAGPFDSAGSGRPYIYIYIYIYTFSGLPTGSGPSPNIIRAGSGRPGSPGRGFDRRLDGSAGSNTGQTAAARRPPCPLPRHAHTLRPDSETPARAAGPAGLSHGGGDRPGLFRRTSGGGDA